MLLLTLEASGTRMDVKATLFKILFFFSGRVPQQIVCAVCQGLTKPQCAVLSLNPAYRGMHCAAHKEQFHAAVLTTVNCCGEPYDPDRDYEWRQAALHE